MSLAVHRIVEQWASARPDAVAILHGTCATTYRELNQTANTLARRLCEGGLTRRSLAVVRLPRKTDLAVVLLAVLKAGACYAWQEGDAEQAAELPASFNILRQRSGEEEKYLALDIDRTLREAASRPSANLPILTRGEDVACVLPDVNGQPQVLVPHATITALPRTSPSHQVWEGCAGALDLWMALMSGATVSLGARAAAAA